MIEKESKFHSFREILGNIINPNIVKAVRIKPILKNVIEIGTCSKIPTIPETSDSIIIEKDVMVFIFRIEIPEALPTVFLQQFPQRVSQVASPQRLEQQLSPQLLQQSSQQL